MAVPTVPLRVPSQSPLDLSVRSVTSVGNDKDDNEIYGGLSTGLLVFTLQLRKPLKTSSSRLSMKAVQSVDA